ncbi:MAG TPA: O-antigen ligase family protein [Candidatus Woesebacteria bacterium]|nr:O-antigen ligase family protein [Candidatus Woesebacteria bacterium]HPR99444.1 O-antigen ligase family protein [Candidatus Woesebacteria bacterium]
MTSIIQFLISILFFSTPLIFTSISSELFEVPKIYFVYLSTLLITLFHLLNYLKGKTVLFSKNNLTIPLLIFFSTQLISTIFSVDIHTSIFGYYSRLNGGLLSLSVYLLLFLILPLYFTPKFRDKIVNLILISGFLVSTFGILEHFGIDKHLWVQDVQSRVFSTLGQPNWLAAYLCILLPFALHKFLFAKTFLQKFSFLFLVSNFYICLLFTKSKSGLIAAIISLAIYFIINLFQKTNFWLLVSSFSFLVILSLTINNPIKDFFIKPNISQPVSQNTSLNITPSEDIRKIVWQGSLDLWRAFPLFGTGPETFGFTYYWTRPASHNLTSEWDFLYNKAHNEYLNYLATTGTFGFLSYLFLIISFLVSCFSSPFIFTAFISILITNFAGFSVVITSLFFFLLPIFVSPKPLAKADHKPKSKIFYFIFIPLFLFLISKILSFFLADIAYNQSQIAYNRGLYDSSQKYIDTALSLRPKEALYHSQAALNAAKLKDAPRAITHSNLALSLSTVSTNLWKERAQVFSELSQINPDYFSLAIEALKNTVRLAPTDAKSFYLLGKFYEAASKTDLAIDNYKQALTLKANYDHASFALGELYFNQKNYPEAKKYFDITLQYAPTNSEAKEYLEKIISL